MKPPTIKLTEDDIDKLTSFADGEIRIRSKYDIGYAELRDLALNWQVERCPHCYWWAESGEMLPPGEDEPDGHCGNCR